MKYRLFRNLLSDSHGVTLVETVIAFTILGIAATGVVEYSRKSFKQDKTIEVRSTWAYHKYLIQDSLNSTQGCTNTFVTGRATPLKIGESFAPNDGVKGKLGDKIAFVNSSYPSLNSEYKIDAIETAYIGPGSKAGQQVVEVAVRIAFLKDVYGSNPPPEKVKIVVDAVDSSAPITGCHGTDTNFTAKDACESLLGGTLIEENNVKRCLNIAGFNGRTNISSNDNTSAGIGSLDLFDTGASRYNTSFGVEAMANAPNSSFGATAIGHQSLLNNAGQFNLGIGAQALSTNSNGSFNTAVGYRSGYKNTTGSYNTYAGRESGKENQIGSYNVAIGEFALQKYTESKAVAIGANALRTATSSNPGTATYNVAVGTNSQENINIGDRNTSVGFNSLRNAKDSFENVAIGSQAMSQATASGESTAVGDSALYDSSGDDNTAVGAWALYSNGDGNWNTAIGTSSAKNSVGAKSNTAIGNETLFAAQGSNNTAIGNYSLNCGNNCTGTENTAAGNYSHFSNTTGNENTSLGHVSLFNNKAGNQNTAIGTYSLAASNSDGNTAVGYAAGFILGTLNPSEYGLTAFGSFALLNATQGENVAFGQSALYGYKGDGDPSHTSNTAFGYYAGFSQNKEGSIFIGYMAGADSSCIATSSCASGNMMTCIGPYSCSLASGNHLIAIGAEAGKEVKGNINIVIGPYAGTKLSGAENTAIGYLSMGFAGAEIKGSRNVGIGSFSNFNPGSGVENTAVGHYVFSNGGNKSANTAIGYMAGTSVNEAHDNSIFIGHNAGIDHNWINDGSLPAKMRNANNTLVVSLGNTAAVKPLLWGKMDPDGGANDTHLIIGGMGPNYNASYAKAAPFPRLYVNGKTYQEASSVWTLSSDLRLKNIIGPYSKGLDDLLKIRPVFYHYKNEDDTKVVPHAGIIAQEIMPIYPSTVNQSKENDILHFNPSEIFFSALNATKEEQNYIEQIQNLQASNQKSFVNDAEQLEIRIVELNRKNEKLKNEFNELKKEVEVLLEK